MQGVCEGTGVTTKFTTKVHVDNTTNDVSHLADWMITTSSELHSY